VVLHIFEGKEPRIGKGTYVSESAELIGDVTIGKKCYIGPGCKIRGDTGKILVGNKTSIQDNCVLHARPGETCKVGNMVTVGHGSILHGCTVRDHAVIGMGAIISDHAVVGVWSIVAEGCVVKSNQIVEDQKIVVGVPAKTVGEVSEEQRSLWIKNKDVYVKLAEKYLKELETC
jgi:carbonic anhydrase/acetyltransferase-like protein (isoleucine patch superfamily)